MTMKTGKMIFQFFLVLVLALSFSGCGKQPVSDNPVPKAESTEISVADQSNNRQEETNTNVSEQTENRTLDEDVAPDTAVSDSSAASGNEATQEDTQAEAQEETEAMLQMRIGDTLVSVDWEDNDSVQALRDLCMDAPLTIQMSMYGGFEQVGSIGTSLPRNDVQTTTGAGDIVLYSGNQIVVFYGSNSWAYTSLGHITDQDAAGMAELLGNGDVTITIRVE